MVNKLKRFFRALGGKSSSSSSDVPSAPSSWSSTDIPVLGGDDCPIGSGPYGSSSAVGFRPRVNPRKAASRRNLNNGYELAFDSFLTSPASSSSVSASPVKPESNRSGIKWGLVLGKIPKLVADATTASQSFASPEKRKPSTASDELDNQEDDGDAGVSAASIGGLLQLRDMLSQMVGNSEFRHEIRVYYFGRPSFNGGSTSGTSRSVTSCLRTDLMSNALVIA